MASDPTDPGGPSGEPDSLSGTTIDGRWRLIDRLGAGGMGVVYRGEHAKLHKRVAVKLLDRRFVYSKDALARFRREARAISRLDHPSCVSILDFGLDGGRPYIVMELVEGRSLREVMGEGLLPLDRAVGILRQILAGLGHAHAHGVVHRDLKPDNVMLCRAPDGSDRVKILDFGLARIIAADEPSLSLPAQIAGTPSYMSPEQAAGERVDHRTDIYSAGVILFGLCVGRKPFATRNLADLLMLHRRQAPPRPREAAPDRGISEPLERVILKSLSKERAQRFYRAEDFIAALDRTPEGKVATGKVPAMPEPRRRGRWLLVAIALGGAAAAATFGARHLGLFTEPPPPVAPVAAPAARAVPSPPTRASAPASAAPPANAPPPEHATPPSPAPAPASVAAPVPAIPVAAAHDLGEAATPDADSSTADASPAPVVKPAIAAPATRPAPAATESPIDATVRQARALLAEGQSREAERLLRALPDSAAAHLELARLYHARLWRNDAIAQWQAALELDPSLRKDPALGAALCTALGPKWHHQGARLLIRSFGADAIAPMTACLHTAPTPYERRAAAAVIERVRRRSPAAPSAPARESRR